MKRKILLSVVTIFMAFAVCSCALNDYISQIKQSNELVEGDFGDFTVEVRKGWKKTTINDTSTYFTQTAFKDGNRTYGHIDMNKYYADIIEIIWTFSTEKLFQNTISDSDTGYTILDKYSSVETELMENGESYDIAWWNLQVGSEYTYYYEMANMIDKKIHFFVCSYTNLNDYKTVAAETKRMALSMKEKTPVEKIDGNNRI